MVRHFVPHRRKLSQLSCISKTVLNSAAMCSTAKWSIAAKARRTMCSVRWRSEPRTALCWISCARMFARKAILNRSSNSTWILRRLRCTTLSATIWSTCPSGMGATMWLTFSADCLALPQSKQATWPSGSVQQLPTGCSWIRYTATSVCPHW